MRPNNSKGSKSSSAPKLSRSRQKAADVVEEASPAKKQVKGKKGKKGKNAMDDSEDEEFGDLLSTGDMTASLTGEDGTTSIAGKSGMKKVKSSADMSSNDFRDVVSESCDDIVHQKPQVRLDAITNLVKALRGSSAKEAGEYLLASYIDTLQTKIVRMLGRQSESTTIEGTKLLELVCILSLILGPDEDDFFNALEPPLKKLVELADAEELQEEAIFTLSFIAFINSEESTAAVWNFVEDVVCNGPDDENDMPYVRALQCWVLLGGTQEDSEVLEHSCDRIFAGVSRILYDDDDLEGRILAGQCLAYLYEVADRINVTEADNTASALAPLVCNNPGVASRTLDVLQQMAKESSKRISKRDRKELHAAFRDIESWIVEGETPSSSVRLQGAIVEMNSFQKLVLMDCLKKVLGDGFQGSLRVYPVLKDILEIGFLMHEDDEGRTKVNKGSKQDKKRAANRRQDRRFAGEESGATVFDQGDGYGSD